MPNQRNHACQCERQVVDNGHTRAKEHVKPFKFQKDIFKMQTSFP